MACVIGLALVVTLLPYAYGWWTCPPDKHFLGLIGQNGHDQAFYLGWGARQAENGHVLFEDKYNGYAERRLVFNPLWLAMGMAARLTGLSVLGVFQLERLGFSVVLLLTAYALIALFVRSTPGRLFALVLLSFSSGLGALLVPLSEWGAGRGHEAVTSNWVTPDLWIVESNVFLSMLWEVVLPCATALFFLVLKLGFELFFEERGSALRVGGATLLLGAIYPYAVLSVYFILGTLALARVLAGRDLRRSLGDYATVVAVALPVVLYDGFLVLTDPRLTTGQALYASPTPLLYLIGLGVPALLAAFGLAVREQQGEGPRSFLAIWVGVTLLQIYAPLSVVPFQMQLILGIQLPLAILSARAAVAGWRRVDTSHRSRALAGAVLLALFALSCVTTVYHLTRVFGQLQRRALPDYIDRDLERAIDWLADNSDEESVVVASPDVAPYIPVFAHNRMYSGDYPAPTADFFEKYDRIRRLFGAEPVQPSSEVIRVLRDERIDWVFYDAGLHRLGGDVVRRQLEANPGLTLMFRNPTAAIYRVLDARGH